MPTTKSRINISLSDTLRDALIQVAIRDQVPQATAAARLIETALELEEDRTWDKLAARRDTKAAHFVPHKEAWS